MRSFKRKVLSPLARAEPVRADGVVVGSTVSHAIFGHGQVVRINGENLTVDFKSGSKRIEASYITPVLD